MKAEILAVGTEILLGDIVNTNAQFLSKELAQLGVEIYYQSVVGDNVQRLEDTFALAFSRADLVITTGGLGPTEDDLTKETGAKYFNLPMELDEKALAHIDRFFVRIGRKMTENNRKQAFVPKGSTVLYNENGTAPGIIVEQNGKILVMLPGPPRETEPMFLNQVKPYLAKKQEYTFISEIFRIAGVGESQMETMVKDLIDAQTNPTIAPYAKNSESILRVTAKAHNEAEAATMIAPVEAEIRKRFGNAVYAKGETELQTVVAELLISKNMTIATAESCTGGMLAAWLVEYPGISKALLDGVVTYSNESKINRLGVSADTLKTYGAVSAQTAAEMALGAAKSANTNIGISTTGVAGPDGGTEEKPVGLVYVGLAINGTVKTKELRFAGKRNKIRERVVYNALDWLRLELLEL